MYAIPAVSYTHLDVYKRQATTFEIYCGIMEAKKEIAKTIDSVMDPAIGAVKVRSKGGIVCM